MIRRKLTKQLKEKIKSDFRKLKQSDFDGEALRYLKQVRGAAKGRSAQKTKKKKAAEKRIEKVVGHGTGKKIKIGDTTVEPGTKAYELISASAKNKNQSIAKFVKENEKAIEQMLKDFLIFFKSEIETLVQTIRELPKNVKIFVPIRGNILSKARAIFILHAIKKTMLELCEIYEVVFIEAAYDLYGNLHFNCPQPGEYKNIEDGEELLEFIDDRYANITYIRND